LLGFDDAGRLVQVELDALLKAYAEALGK
jgi:hypothetical protein